MYGILNDTDDLDVCVNGHSPQEVMHYILSAAGDTLLNNFCKIPNDKFSAIEAKRKLESVKSWGVFYGVLFPQYSFYINCFLLSSMQINIPSILPFSRRLLISIFLFCLTKIMHVCVLHAWSNNLCQSSNCIHRNVIVPIFSRHWVACAPFLMMCCSTENRLSSCI